MANLQALYERRDRWQGNDDIDFYIPLLDYFEIPPRWTTPTVLAVLPELALYVQLWPNDSSLEEIAAKIAQIAHFYADYRMVHRLCSRYPTLMATVYTLYWKRGE